jgi:hypothetical protein
MSHKPQTRRNDERLDERTGLVRFAFWIAAAEASAANSDDERTYP